MRKLAKETVKYAKMLFGVHVVRRAQKRESSHNYSTVTYHFTIHRDLHSQNSSSTYMTL